MMRAALQRGQRGPALIAALVAFMLLLGAGWAGSFGSGEGLGSSRCACPCETDEGASEGLARDVARRPDCCASEDPSSIVVAGLPLEPPEPWGADVPSSDPAARAPSVPRPGLTRHGSSTGPPPERRVFLRHQAFLI